MVMQEVQYSEKRFDRHLMSSSNVQSLNCDFSEKERQLTTLLQIYIAWLNTVFMEIFTMKGYVTD